jgi:putative heme-binding domain-containing protein
MSPKIRETLRCLFLLVLTAICWTPPHVSAAEPATPQWIWVAGVDRDGRSAAKMQRSFVVPQVSERARLRATSDFAALSIVINGRSVAALEPYDPPIEIDVARHLTAGTNTLIASAVGVSGPSAIAVSLEVLMKAHAPLLIQSGQDWEAADGAEIADFGSVHPHRWALNQMPEVSPFAEYNQWKEALGGNADSQLSPLPLGFEIKKVRAAQEGEDSWISLAIAPDGRLIIGNERQGLLRLTLSDDGEQVVSADTIGESLEECRGLVWRGDSLFVHANRTGGLFRLRDIDGDDRFAEVTCLVNTDGGSGHGRNALVVGPDESIHAIVGDDIRVPDASVRRARPEAAAPHELGHHARIGEQRGETTWEALNRGLRNPYGIDFNADGEAFTYDADNEGDAGLPFYRPTRINHLVSGANYGWHQDRQNTRSLPIYAPDSLPTTLDIGRGSPTGVRFGTRSHFPAPWRDALFALDWAYGRILAVHLTPRGASYYGSGELFLEGRPLNVTDLDFDSDGSLWFVTGGRKTQSALYRIRYVGDVAKSKSPPQSDQAEARAAFSMKSREVRRSLERFHGQVDPEAVDAAWPSLSDADPWIRGAARVAIEWQPVDNWRERAFASAGDLGGLTAMLALARAGTDQDRQLALTAIAAMDLAHWSQTEKLTWLRIHQLAGPPDVLQSREPIDQKMMSMVEDDSAAVRREVAAGLVMLNSLHAVPFALRQLLSASSQSDRLFYLEVLSDAKQGWSPEQRKQFFTVLAHAKRYSNGDRFMPPFFDAIEKSALANVDDAAERSQLAELLMTSGTTPGIVPSPTQEVRPFVRQWKVDELAEASADGDANGEYRGDARRGRDLFIAASCANCHVCGSVGMPAGPDLTTVARRFGRRDLLESIVEPSKVIAEAYLNVVVLHSDGSVTTGRIIRDDFRESKLVLAPQGDAASELISIPKGEIQSWHESPVSPMPSGLLDTLTREEIEDLLLFLLSGGGSN